MVDDLIPVFRNFNSQEEISEFYDSQYKELELYLFALTPEELIEQRHELKELFHALEQSPAITRILANGDAAHQDTQQLVILLATILSKAGIYSPIFSIISFLPDSSIKFRFKAALLNSRITNVRTGYIEKTEKILDLFVTAQFDEDGSDFTQEIVIDFINYYNYVKDKLTARGYNDELASFHAQFVSREFIEGYPFLSHESIVNFLRGIELAEIVLAPSTGTVYELSYDLYNVLRSKVSATVLDNKNANGDGYYELPKLEILNDALERGRADFREGYKHLTPDKKVLLYCFFNMKKHFSSSYFLFDKMDNLLTYFDDPTFKPLMIDLGCGPLTSGLALGDYYYTSTDQPVSFNYIGIDIAPEMIAKAKEFTNSFCFAPTCKFRFEPDWNKTYDFIEQNVKGKNLILINASYLFASSSLNVDDLANFVNVIARKYRTNPIYFVFQNSRYSDRNVNYDRFKGLIVDLAAKHSNTESVKYRTIPGSMGSFTEEEVKYEILSNT